MNIRQILESSGIEVWDRGNTSKNQFSIHCPYCGPQDPSHHMSISPIGEIYCFRNKKHGGRNLVRLFKKLGIPRVRYEHLKLGDQVLLSTGSSDQGSKERDYSAWNYFTPAEENEEALLYLQSRLFQNPIETAKKFKLKVSKEGMWAGQLLIPLYPVGWTGRAMRDSIDLRYKTHTDSESFYYYSYGASSAILCEGALDCMRVGMVSTQFDLYGKCRIEMSPRLLAQLMEKKYSSIYSVPDSNVSFSQKRDELVQLRSYCTYSIVKQFNLDNKDFCATTESDTRRILGEFR